MVIHSAFVYLVRRGADRPPFRPSVDKHLKAKERVSLQVTSKSAYMHQIDLEGRGADLVEMLVLPIPKSKHPELEVAQPLTPLVPL